jgi:hypothetical protein
MKRLKSCQACFESEEQLINEIRNNSPRWEGENRDIYFAPCGNHHLFGLFNSGRTPKVVIMGITTSPDAKDNFQWIFKQCIEKDLPFDEALRACCIANCFNSKNPKLQNTLSNILELSGVLKIIGVKGPVEIGNNLFFDYVKGDDSEDQKKVVENVYFSQAILCSSCKKGGGANAPRRQDIDYHHKSCLKAQGEIVESFDSEVDLWISFGTSDAATLSSEGCFHCAGLQNRIRGKCKKNNYVRINHPVTKGWNLLRTTFKEILRNDPEIDRREFFAQVSQKIPPIRGYDTQVLNCAEQLMRLREIVNSLVSS